jgi:F-type H+-transporting ATPase subunit delta
MKLNKEVRQMGRELLRASFTGARLDRGKIAKLIEALVAKKPRHYLDILEFYKRLLRLELEKRHARIESAQALNGDVSAQVVGHLTRRYGEDLTTEFVVDPTLLGGMRVRVGSDVWDSTVKSRLERLASQL